MNPIEFYKDNFTISTDPVLLDVQAVHHYLSQESYWAQGRSLEVVETSIKNSLCFGVYTKNQQIGFARVITDYAVFAYILDLFIVDEYKGQGLGKWLMSSIMSHPQLLAKMGWSLNTRDAHGLYEQYGFKANPHPEFSMVCDKRK